MQLYQTKNIFKNSTYKNLIHMRRNIFIHVKRIKMAASFRICCSILNCYTFVYLFIHAIIIIIAEIKYKCIFPEYIEHIYEKKRNDIKGFIAERNSKEISLEYFNKKNL